MTTLAITIADVTARRFSLDLHQTSGKERENIQLASLSPEQEFILDNLQFLGEEEEDVILTSSPVIPHLLDIAQQQAPSGDWQQELHQLLTETE